MKYNSGQIKASVAAYLRYIRQYYLVAFEAYNADILALNKADLLTEIEVKISLGDLRKDKAKTKHWRFKNDEPDRYLPRRHFYFAVPKDLAIKACLICSQLYPYAGVIGTNGGTAHTVEVFKKPKSLSQQPIIPSQIQALVKQQSGTVCRLAMKLNDIDYKLG